MTIVTITIEAEIENADEKTNNDIEGTVNDMRTLVLQAVKDSEGIKFNSMRVDVESEE